MSGCIAPSKVDKQRGKGEGQDVFRRRLDADAIFLTSTCNVPHAPSR